MDPWVLSDGTKVYLGGRVEGQGEFAPVVRLAVRTVASGERLTSYWGPVPHEARLNFDEPHLVNSWLRAEFGADLVSAPEFDQPTAEPRPPEPPGAVY
jgi:hypothetical protein